MKTVMIGDIRYHLPFIDLIQFDEEQNAELGKSIREAGRIRVPIVCWKEKSNNGSRLVVDGAHRVLWAKELGLAKVPAIMESYENEEQAKADCEEINLERRHLTAAQLAEHRAARIARVAELRRQGESLRSIAEQEEIGLAQVRRDLVEVSGVPGGGTPEPENKKVLGKDGKTYPTTAAKPKKKCGDAKEEIKPTAASDEVKDHHGNVVPKRRRAVWSDTWIRETYDFLCSFSEQFRMQRIGDGMHKRAKHFPFFIPRDVIDGCGFVIDYLDRLIEHFKEARPSGVCPICDGDGCGDCRNAGLVPRELYKTLKARAKT